MLRSQTNNTSPRREKPKSMTFISPSYESSITQLTLTKAHFLDTYSKGKWNLSQVPRPQCCAQGFMKPPECYFESARTKPVKTYSDLPHWNNKSIFKKMIRELRDTFKVTGVSISIVESQRTIFKVETMLGMGDLPRAVSIDGHAILSQGYFLLLDAATDWRTSSNPLVTGTPHIRFYCGVPLYTAKKDLVGVVAIFDSTAKRSFSEDQCKQLQQASKAITAILETPVDELSEQPVRKNPLDSELSELSIKLGRATSTKSSLSSVFEKDGSGGAYSSNYSYRFSHLVRPESASNGIDNHLLWEKLYGVRNMRNAAMLLTKAICAHYGFDFGYIMEIRIAEPFKVPPECFPKTEARIKVENYRYADQLVKDTQAETEYMSRIVGIHGSPHKSLNFENSVHQDAFMSEFGIQYRSLKQAMYNKGIIMPFYRHSSKLVRKKIQKSADRVDVYLRSEGFLIALFNMDKNVDYDDEMVSAVFENACNLRKIYIH